MADRKSTSDQTPFRYCEYDWGDLIEGTKEHLQSFGLGLGLAFPGEVGGPKRKLKVLDPRGLEATISPHYWGEGFYSAHIDLPGLPPRQDNWSWTDAGSGLKKRTCRSSDEYAGSADALVAAGLVRPDQFPGQPGMRSTRVTILPDGSLPGGSRHTRHPDARSSGARVVERISARTYSVLIWVSDEEKARRQDAEDAASAEWLAHVRSLPRPERLEPINQRDSARPEKAQPGRASVTHHCVLYTLHLDRAPVEQQRAHGTLPAGVVSMHEWKAMRRAMAARGL